MFCDGLIFRGKRLVNWDPHLQTAVADDEVFTEDVDGHFWTFNYPVVDDSGEPTGRRFISPRLVRKRCWAIRPCAFIRPTNATRDLVGKHVRIPVNGRLIPIIADALLADKELGTGAVKVTPAHDPNDYACGLRNDLEMINILNPDGTINEEGGEFAGLDRYDARKAIVAKMDELGHFDGVEDRKIPVKHSDRSKTPIEPYLSDQWFVKMDELAQSAMDAVEDGRVKIFPQRYTKTYLDWLGEKRDWCISRQLWWGHRIPVWSQKVDESRVQHPEPVAVRCDDGCRAGAISFAAEFDGILAAQFADGLMPGEELLLACVDAGNEDIESRLSDLGFEQDPDVLDTWFSSALWPHATLGWPDMDHNPPLQAGSRTRHAMTSQIDQ